MKTISKSKMHKALHKIHNKLSLKESLFLLNMMVCGFCLAAEAAITKSVSTSFFIDAYDTSLFPIAWLTSLPLNLLVVIFYNNYIAKLGPKRMMASALFATALFNIFCAFTIKGSQITPFALYIWKEVFVMFMFHNLWSVVHSTMNLNKAKYLYGIFFGLGGLGSVFGGYLSNQWAESLGSHNLLLITVPLYMLTLFVYQSGVRLQPFLNGSQKLNLKKENANFRYGLKLIKDSKILLFILILVICMQMTSTIIEFQFNIELKHVFASLDQRTAFLGKILALLNIVNVFLQFIGSFILVKFLGLLSLHLLIPIFLLSNLVIYFFFPSFGLMCVNYGAIKSIDYSLFGIVTAMLYIPLSVEEKFQGKSIISILGYRGAKALVSVLSLGLAMVSRQKILSYLFFIAAGIFALWILSTYLLKKSFKERYA
jgi:ATP:ADP antiporter, AAA family